MAILRSDIISNVNTGGKTGWCQNNLNIQKDFFSAVESCLALNAIPSPFARIEVVKQAFDAISNSVNNISFNSAGFTYRQLVSDTLDVLELLYEYELYKDIISIRNCKISQLNFPKINSKSANGAANNISFIQKALEDYKYSDEVYLVIYNDSNRNMVLAMSSPETLFFTTNRLDRNNGQSNEYDFRLKRRDNSGTSFFDVPLALSERSKYFQDYIYNLYIVNKSLLGNTSLGKYIEKEYSLGRNNDLDSNSVSDLCDDGLQPVKLLLSNGGHVQLKKNSRPQSAALIRNKIIDLGYQINKDKFVTIKQNETCLFPINLDILGKISNPESIISNLTVSYNNVKTNDSNGSNYELQVEKSSLEYMIPFDIGVYPFFKYPKEYNIERKNTYNVILVYKHKNGYDNNAIELSFYRNINGKIEKLNTYSREQYEDANLGIRVGVIKEKRSNIKSPEGCVKTLHYTIIGAQFDYIQVDFNLPDIKTSGTIKPIFTQPKENSERIKYAIDFGTTSTYVACKCGDKKPTSLFTNEQSMVFLHGNPSKNNESKVYKYESYQSDSCNNIEKNIPELVKYVKNEFVPTSIGHEVYKFPIRTSMSCKVSEKPMIFENTNIAFTYDKEPSIGSNNYITNIKWDSDKKDYSTQFIHQLIRMCVLDAFSKGYNKDKIDFLYFYPLSMNEDYLIDIEKAWSDGCKSYDIPEKNLKRMTESLAPYYAEVKDDASCVVSIDIGGGSVDTVVYQDRKAQIAFSALFGCDILWSGGKNLSSNDKSNPLYCRLRPEVEKINCKVDLKDIQKIMLEKDSDYSSKEIINFWLNNDEVFDITSKIRLSKYKPIYVGHFYALLYHVAQVMKVNNIDIPTEITLSGNGSIYLSYINKNLSAIAKAAFEIVYGECNKNIKVTLPEYLGFKGKEMTAIGGLKYCYDSDGETLLNDKNIIYVGECLSDYNESLSDNKDMIIKDNTLNETVVETICKNVKEMETGLIHLLDDFKMDIGNFSSTIEEYRTTLKDIVENKVYGRCYISSKKIESTLFFVPIQQMIFKIEENIKD